MTEPPETPRPLPTPQPVLASKTPEQVAKAERATRLAKALRDNLRRRKTAKPGRVGN